MNDLENYKKIVESVFLQKFDIPINDMTNNCIGALNCSDTFMIFKENFIDRLKRLSNYYAKKPAIIEKLLITLKNIGVVKGYKWSGGYSELVALDYWIQYKEPLKTPS